MHLQNCWPWMQATKHENTEQACGLGPQLEGLLAAYAKSTGSETGGVPAELVQGATEITAEQAPLQQSGPADAAAEEDAHLTAVTLFPHFLSAFFVAHALLGMPGILMVWWHLTRR